MQLNFSFFTVILCLFISVSGFAEGLDSLRLEQKDGQYYVIHRVEKGETLYSLSRRYGATLPGIQAANGLSDTNISLEQELKIPIQKPDNATVVSSPTSGSSGNSADAGISTANAGAGVSYHTVAKKETLYSISREYGVTVPQLQEWNDLSGNEISIGQQLVVGKGSNSSNSSGARKSKPDPKTKNRSSKPVPYGYTEYYVQNGDLIETIASKFSVRPDSIVIWNDLPNTYLTIGQKLLIKGKIDSEKLKKKEKVEELPYGQRREVTDQSGFVKIYEVGSARKIEDVVETDKYLALHRDLDIGALVEVRNLMNNQKIFVRIVGKLPETGLNENVLIRLTPICFDRLGVIDPKTRVEVSYYKE